MENMHAKALPSSFFLPLTFFILILAPNPSNSAIDSFVYAGCSPITYNPTSQYQSTINTVLVALVNSATFSNFNNYSLPIANQHSTIYALFQCRGDLSNTDCQGCITNAANQLGSYCVGTKGGELQLEGCYMRYDNVSFFGVEEKNLVSDKCGPEVGGDNSDFLVTRNSVLAYLASGGPYFRVTGTGRVQGMAQCVRDLSASECQDCLSDAIQRLRSECVTSSWGDIFLGKCYARYTTRGYSTDRPRNGNGHGNGDGDGNRTNDTDKTLAEIIGIVAGVILLIVFLSYCSKKFDNKGDK